MYETKNKTLFRESAFTLRAKRTTNYSFSRAARFRDHKASDVSEFVILPSTLDRRGTALGYGGRWTPGNKSGFNSPAPGSYNLPSTLNTKTGPRYTKDSPLRDQVVTDYTPGPGSYNTTQPIGKFAPKFSMRPKNLRTRSNDSPPPNAYQPVFIYNTAYKNITFGIGERNFIKKPSIDIPGPGAYEYRSEFTKTPI
jgi:Sperm-tail PG-rich repeat